MDRNSLIAHIESDIATMERAIEMRRHVIALHNTVVRTSPGLYLVPKGDGYGVGALTQGVVMWSPSDAAIQAKHGRGFPGGEDSTAVPYVTALRDEIKASRDLIATLARPVAKAA